MGCKILHAVRTPVMTNGNIFRQVAKRLASTGINKFASPELTVPLKKEIESYWKDKANLNNKYDESATDKKKFYVLSMFPYPSGTLHMGHVRVYTISDAIARFYRMQGYNVMYPMAWDAFGLPAENAAIEKGVDPRDWTRENIKRMRKQLDRLNYSFDWSREFTTCEPEYYRWTQELFLKLYEHGLAYQKESYVNWDPVDQTVLAEEQVDANNQSWRSGARVEKKLLKQWFVRTTVYAKSLLEGLDDPMLIDWNVVRKMQKNWIGQCDGYGFDFKVSTDMPNCVETINLWTEHPEFVEHAKFVAVSSKSSFNRPEHTREVAPGIKEVDAKVLNPFNNKELRVFVSDKITYKPLRDNHLGIPAASMEDLKFSEEVGIQFDRHDIRTYEQQQAKLQEVISKAREWKIGGYPVSARLKDWLISRQRYWGAPIPIIHCDECGAQPVPRESLPVPLPKIDYRATGRKNTLRDARDWLETTCPKCGGRATREVDTMDTFVDSSWYFLRFVDPSNQEEICPADKAKNVLPVDLYIGGMEHAVLHLYYARFVNHFLHDRQILPTREPFRQLLVHGLVMAKSYQVESTGQYVREDDVECVDGSHVQKVTGEPVRVRWDKMSKSKHNGTDPMDLLEEHGVDMLRLLLLADVSPTAHRNWSTDTIPGIRNWQNRMWRSVREFKEARDGVTEDELKMPFDDALAKEDDYMFDSRNYFLKCVNQSLQKSHVLNLAISRMQGLTNSLRKISDECVKRSPQYERALAVQIIMLVPFAPHFAAELWSGFCAAKHHLLDGQEVDITKDAFEQKWPEIDMNYKMVLNVRLNNSDCMKVKVPRRDLERLTSSSAVELIENEPAYRKVLADFNVEDVKLSPLTVTCCDRVLNVSAVRKARKQKAQRESVEERNLDAGKT